MKLLNKMDYFPSIILCRIIALMFLFKENSALNTIQFKSNDPNQEWTKIALKYIDEHSKQLQLPKSKNLTLILGNTGSNKTLLQLFATKEELEVVETSDGRYHIIDRFNKIERYSESIGPELITNKRMNMDYYVIPDFSRIEDSISEINAMYLIHRVFKFANAVKFIFTIDYAMVHQVKTRATDDQILGARELILNVTRLIKNIGKFNSSIGLVITNAINDPKYIRASILEHTAFVLRESLNIKPACEECHIFTDNLLQTVHEPPSKRYLYVDIVRSPNETGIVNDIKWMQNDRNYLSMVLHNEIKYVKSEINDFQYLLSTETIERIPALLNEIKSNVISELSALALEIQSEFTRQESRLMDIKVLHDRMEKGYTEMSKVNAADAVVFGSQFVNALMALEFDKCINDLNLILNHIELIDFLSGIINSSRSFRIADSLKSTIKYFYESNKWYSFASEVHDILSQHSVQKNIEEHAADVGKLMNEFTILEYATSNVNKTGLKKFLEKVGSNIDPEIGNISVNFYKLDKMKRVFNVTMSGALDIVCLPGKFIAKGYNVRMNDIVFHPCFDNAKDIEVMAINKLFLDANITKTGSAKLSIISPTWEIVGNITINLSGLNGESHEPAAAPDGSYSSRNGIFGKPGKPGMTSGSIFYIGKTFINDQNLEIILNGGKGGPGQHGGNGLF